MTFVLGVDGGGTGTRAVVLDGEGVERGRGEGPPGLVERIGALDSSAGRDRRGGQGRSEGLPGAREPEEAATAVETAARAAARASDIALPVDHLCAGLAGAGSPEIRGEVRRALEDRGLSHAVVVTTDAHAALRDAFPGEEAGVLLVCGTGSIALGRTGAGWMARAGGWGAVLDDAGSAYRIGLEALSAVLRAHDGRAPETALTELTVGFMGVSAPPELVAAAHGAPKHRIAALAPAVVELAGGGDGTAKAILREAVLELTSLARAVLTRLGESEGAEGATHAEVPVALHGGLVAPGRPLRPLLVRSLEEQAIPVLERRVDPARGAGRLALDGLHRTGS